MKINKNTFSLENEERDIIASIVEKIAKDNDIDNVEHVSIELNKENGVLSYKIAKEDKKEDKKKEQSKDSQKAMDMMMGQNSKKAMEEYYQIFDSEGDYDDIDLEEEEDLGIDEEPLSLSEDQIEE